MSELLGIAQGAEAGRRAAWAKYYELQRERDAYRALLEQALNAAWDALPHIDGGSDNRAFLDLLSAVDQATAHSGLRGIRAVDDYYSPGGAS